MLPVMAQAPHVCMPLRALLQHPSACMWATSKLAAGATAVTGAIEQQQATPTTTASPHHSLHGSQARMLHTGSHAPHSSHPNHQQPPSQSWGMPQPLPNRRVVITGLGLVTPLGVGVQASWDALVAGKTGWMRTRGGGLHIPFALTTWVQWVRRGTPGHIRAHLARLGTIALG